MRRERLVQAVRLRRLPAVARDSAIVDQHDAVGIHDVRRRVQQQPVDDAEHRAVRADAQRERAGDGGGESDAAPHAAEREGEVVAECLEHNAVRRMF